MYVSCHSRKHPPMCPKREVLCPWAFYLHVDCEKVYVTFSRKCPQVDAMEFRTVFSILHNDCSDITPFI